MQRREHRDSDDDDEDRRATRQRDDVCVGAGSRSPPTVNACAIAVRDAGAAFFGGGGRSESIADPWVEPDVEDVDDHVRENKIVA